MTDAKECQISDCKLPMQGVLALLLLLELMPYSGCDAKNLERERTLSRKRRYLFFPQGSVAVINLSYATALIWEYTNAPTPTWNTISETDINFNLPNDSVVAFGKKNGKNKRGSAGYYDLHRSQRLELFRKIEGLMELYGVNGHDCFLRTLCEAQQRLKPGKSFVEDILYVVFRIPYGSGDEFEAAGYMQPNTEAFCESLRHSCHFSLLKYLLQE